MFQIENHVELLEDTYNGLRCFKKGERFQVTDITDSCIWVRSFIDGLMLGHVCREFVKVTPKVGDEYIAVEDLTNALGCSKVGELLEITEVLRLHSLDDAAVYRFINKETGHIFSTIYIEKWFKPANSNVKEEEMFEENKFNSGQWIVGSIEKATQRVSFSANPKIHCNKLDAMAEAKRLAKQHTSKEFMAVQIGGIASTADVVVR